MLACVCVLMSAFAAFFPEKAVLTCPMQLALDNCVMTDQRCPPVMPEPLSSHVCMVLLPASAYLCALDSVMFNAAVLIVMFDAGLDSPSWLAVPLLWKSWGRLTSQVSNRLKPDRTLPCVGSGCSVAPVRHRLRLAAMAETASARRPLVSAALMARKGLC